ncbi:YncE family protein [Polaribacter porphyrae]|uniref:Cell surface protein n=1 Tax=Polaribacter porphyrae TaxID=1137780 RepID=A0A2S7WLS5_9FLAO|nr:DUF5074 domain-containing protein [Polaribacter porphyrae]PQJ78416.1 hypothetical protein BTO18_04065 [Polaribacter porphyrae]
MNIKKRVIASIFSITLLASCSSSEDPILPKGDYDNGILVTNEGAFSGGTGTINYISDDFSTTETKVYDKVNGESIGTVLQSIGFNDDDAYLVVNVANKVIIADRYTMKKSTEITSDLNNPRYIAFANNKAFVTNWGSGFDATDDYIAVINLTSNIVEAKISVIEGPEQIIANGNTIYVSHKGGFGSGSSVTAINASDNSVIKNISVGSIPDEMVLDSSGNLLVSCEGKAQTQWNPTEELGSLVKINTATNDIASTMPFASGFHPNNLVLSDGNLFISTATGVFKMSENASTIPSTAIITTTVGGLSVNDNKIYVTDVKDFQSEGTLTIFDANTNAELKEFTVGLIPRKIYFN